MNITVQVARTPSFLLPDGDYRRARKIVREKLLTAPGHWDEERLPSDAGRATYHDQGNYWAWIARIVTHHYQDGTYEECGRYATREAALAAHPDAEAY